ALLGLRRTRTDGDRDACDRADPQRSEPSRNSDRSASRLVPSSRFALIFLGFLAAPRQTVSPPPHNASVLLAPLDDFGKTFREFAARVRGDIEGVDGEHALWALEQLTHLCNMAEFLRADCARRVERSGVWARRGERTGEAFVA